jgi:hypothetical protein
MAKPTALHCFLSHLIKQALCTSNTLKEKYYGDKWGHVDRMFIVSVGLVLIDCTPSYDTSLAKMALVVAN